MGKIRKGIMKAFTMEHIDVKKARRTANLKALGAGRLLHKTIDTAVVREDYFIPVRMYFPDDKTKQKCIEGFNDLPVIMYIHGGGWVTDSVDNYERISHRLAKYTKHLIISVDYRLAPEYKFPTGLLDCYEVAKSICQGTFTYPIHTEDITIMGDSAGGNLAAVLCQMCRDNGDFSVTKQVLIYPVTNSDYSEKSPYESVHTKGVGYGLTAGRMRDYVAYYKSSDEDLKNPYFAPILAKDFTHLPEALVITAENDPLRDEGEAYASRLREAGNRVEMHRIENAMHGYFGLGMNGPLMRATLPLIDRFLRSENG